MQKDKKRTTLYDFCPSNSRKTLRGYWLRWTNTKTPALKMWTKLAFNERGGPFLSDNLHAAEPAVLKFDGVNVVAGLQLKLPRQ